MKYIYYATESQYNAGIRGRKAPRGSRYVPKKNYDGVKTFALALVVGLILMAVYLFASN